MPSTLRGKIEHWIKSYTYLIHIVPVLCDWYAQNKKSILMHKSHWLSDILWRFTHSVPLSVRILWSSNCTPFRSTRVDVRFLTCGLCCSISWVLCVVLCRSLLVFLPFFFLPLCYLSFFELHILITSLVSSSSSWCLYIQLPLIYIFMLHSGCSAYSYFDVFNVFLLF